MKKRLNIIVIGILAVALIIAVLLYNKSRMEARAKNDIVTSIPVTVTKVARQRVDDDRSIVGIISANNDVQVISETQGRIVTVSTEVGQYKSAGAVLVQVDDEMKQAAFATAEVNYEKSKKDLQRYENLQKDSAVSDQQLENARMAFKAAEAQYVVARREYRDTKITTPIAGIVTSRPVDVGAYVQRGTLIANVVDLSRLKVKVSVAENEVFTLRTGDLAGVSTDVYPGVLFQGKIQTISSKADDAHTYAVEVLLPNNKNHPLKVGMFGRVSFQKLGREEMVVIPRISLVGSVKSPRVFVVRDSKAFLRDLILGPEIGNYLTVLGGVQEGETIIVTGQNNVKDSSMVSVTNQE
jgi:RND family efflux transporter MFP subunit